MSDEQDIVERLQDRLPDADEEWHDFDYDVQNAIREIERLRAASPSAATADDLRRRDLVVAVHNDYRQGGKLHTFWLMTHQQGDTITAYKGEGESDAAALDKIRAQVVSDYLQAPPALA